ncbi:MAG: 2Fe-2S iron-sulfur cluster-binding protein [Bauldia sp.]
MTPVALTVNGRAVLANLEPRTSLADYLRDRENLTGTHLGCEHGVCGACTLLIDGVPARSCITLAAACAGAGVTTIEGLDEDEIAAELRDAFKREHALQCGYCTPGMIVSARDLVLRAPNDNEHEVRVAMSGNLCRCTGYVGIVKAIRSVIAARRARGIAPVPGAGRTALGPAGARPGAAALPLAAMPPAPRPAPAVATPAAAAPTDFTPQQVVQKSFSVPYPRNVVWAFFLDPAAVAACLPGASLTGAPDARNVAGKLRIKVGPIVADFHGAAVLDRDPASFTGSILGSGADSRSRSSARGKIGYRLAAEGPATTRVDVTIGYTLTGPLAQFGRSRLVDDIVDRLIAAFVANLKSALAAAADGSRHIAPTAAPVVLDAGNLILGAFAAQLKAFLRRVFTRI